MLSRLITIFLAICIVSVECASLQKWIEFPSASISKGHALDGNTFVADRRGILYQIGKNEQLHVSLNISDRVSESGYGGLLDFDLAERRWGLKDYLFVWYTRPSGEALKIVISAFPFSKQRDLYYANEHDEVVLLTQDGVTGEHIGGWLQLAKDGSLLVSIGDGSGDTPSNSSQDPNTYLGKMLRILPNYFNLEDRRSTKYTIPYGNPKRNSPIFASGLRQPFNCRIDESRRVYEIPQVYCWHNGADSWESVILVTAGSNHGWPCYEGFERTSTPCPRKLERLSSPVLVYPHNSPSANSAGWNKVGQSIIGGVFYKGNKFPQWRGDMLFGDLYGSYFVASKSTVGDSWTLDTWEIDASEPQMNYEATISLFEDERNEVVVVTSSFNENFEVLKSTLYKLV